MIIYVNREASTSSDNDSPRASGSSRPFTSNSKDLRHADTFSATAEQKRRQPTLRHTASMSTVSAPPEPLPRSRKSIEITETYDRQPQNHPFTGKTGFAWPFHKAEITIQLPLKEKSRNIMSTPASKVRMVGRGGSGSQLRQVSLTEAALLEPEPNVHNLRQPLYVEPEHPFFRPTGRGGLGSLSTRPMTPLKPLKPPVAIIGMLRGKKQGGSGLSISQSVVSDPSDDTDSYIEDVCPTCHEHRQRSLNKISRTLGTHPSPRKLSKRPATSSDSLDVSRHQAHESVRSSSSGHNWASSTSTDEDDLEEDDADDDPPQRWVGDSRSSYETMTFSPPSPLPTHGKPHPEVSSIAQPRSSKESSSSSSTTRIYVSNHSTSHFDAVPGDNDTSPDPSGLDNVQREWLVPHNDELVISITRAAPSKPQSWTGEWNGNIENVIQGLRRL